MRVVSKLWGALGRWGVAAGIGAGVMLVPKLALANNCWADGTCAVAFVHGTGDQTDSLDNYWTNDAVCEMVGQGAGCSLPGWVTVVNYAGGSCDASGYTCSDKVRTGRQPGDDANCHACSSGSASWQDITDQLDNYLNTSGYSTLFVVTHSNGINPIRYMLSHTSAVTPNGNTVSQAVASFREVLAVAGDFQGTPLANSVTDQGTLASFANDILDLFGSGYNNPAVKLQRTDNMSLANGNGWFNDSAGVPISTIHGTKVPWEFWEGDAYCGGYGYNVGLQAARCYGWGCSSCSDGFIGCDSATNGYTSNDLDSTLAGAVSNFNSDHLSHNGSRRACVGMDQSVLWALQNLTYTGGNGPEETPASMACNATVQTWVGSYFSWGCPSSYTTDGVTDYDCYIAYGGDNGYSALPGSSTETVSRGGKNYTYTINTGYSGTFYSSKFNSQCSDTWLGDGHCDLCLVAKYGFDGIPGSPTGADDCVDFGPGTSNSCYDLMSTSSSPRYPSTGWYYVHYQANH